MAVRKETIKQQFGDALPAVLEPGEQVQAGAYLVSGPSPMWVAGILGLIGILLFNVRYHYLAVTDRRVIFYAASFWRSSPKGLAWADRRYLRRLSRRLRSSGDPRSIGASRARGLCYASRHPGGCSSVR